jgi:hypothetical protein
VSSLGLKGLDRSSGMADRSPRRLNSASTPSPDAEGMTTNATATNPAVSPATVVLDPLFGEVLRPEDLPVRALQLPCARCGRTSAAHGGHPPDCDGFVRPGLPLGYVYVDQLNLGDAFRFTSRGSDADVRVAAHEPFALDEETGLVQVQSSIPGTEEVVHLVQANTIVRRDTPAA